MLSEKIKNYLQGQALYDAGDDENYQSVLTALGIAEDSAIADFNMHTNAIMFPGEGNDLYNICWFALNSSYYEQIENMQQALGLPKEYIPLDSFEGEGGYFYNRQTGEVIELELGQVLNDFQAGRLQPQWKNFNLFLEYYFGID